MKNKKLITILLCAVAVGAYFISTYTTGKILCKKLNLESAEKVVVDYDNGGEVKKPDNYKMTLTDSQKQLLIDHIKDLRLKKHRDDYMFVNSFEQYTFDFQFDDYRIKLYMFGDEFIQVLSINGIMNGTYYIAK